MNLFGNKRTRALILIMCALVLSGIAVSYFYYGNINRSTDPRIVEARIYMGNTMYMLNIMILIPFFG